MSKTESVDPVVAGSGTGNLVYTVTAHNAGPSDVTGASFTEALTLPAGVTVVPSPTPGTGSVGGSSPNYTWTGVNISAGGDASLLVTLTVALSANEGNNVISDTATLTGSTGGETIILTSDDAVTEATSIRWPMATWTVYKEYTEDGAGPVNVHLECIDSSGLLVYGSQPEATEATLSVKRFDIPTGTSCHVIEDPVPVGYYQLDRSPDCDVDPTQDTVDAEDYECTITNAVTWATFDVYKTWNQDGVPITRPVDVHMVCTSGEPTTADTTISVAQYGTFQVEGFENNMHNCTITEDVPENYTATYSPPGAGGDDEAGCLFEDITAEGEYRCDITNTPDPGALTVTKTWILAGANAGYDGDYEIKVSCDSEVDEPDNCDYVDDPTSDDPEDLVCAHTYYMQGNAKYKPPLFEVSSNCKSGGCYARIKANASLGDYNYEFGIPNPNYPASGCTIEESFDDAIVESQNDCADPEEIGAGDVDVSCEIVNTVFFEGIPTLNQYGMAILALLMLGVGFVGFRRFA
jgi:uncharacterized repeat protein (TIGR01451 family)